MDVEITLLGVYRNAFVVVPCLPQKGMECQACILPEFQLMTGQNEIRGARRIYLLNQAAPPKVDYYVRAKVSERHSSCG